MTRDDVARIADEIAILWAVSAGSFWGRASDSRSSQAGRVAEHFAGFLPERILSAVRECAHEDAKHPPNPAQILERARAQHKPSDSRRLPSECAHPQPWGIVEEADGKRWAVCRFCQTEFVRPSEKFLTAAEVEDRKCAKEPT